MYAALIGGRGRVLGCGINRGWRGGACGFKWGGDVAQLAECRVPRCAAEAGGG